MPERETRLEPRETGTDHPQVLFDPGAGCNYHLEGEGGLVRVDHGIPEGYAFTPEGVLEPVPEGGVARRRGKAKEEEA